MRCLHRCYLDASFFCSHQCFPVAVIVFNDVTEDVSERFSCILAFLAFRRRLDD